MNEIKIGVIGGSGLYELEGLTDVRWTKVKTPFGDPSDAYCVGRLGNRTVVFLPRHGRGHRLMPSELNFRANIYGFKALGVEWVISISAVGSMREDIRPLDLVIPDQFFDWTKRRPSTFFGNGIVAHVGMADPVCQDLADRLEAAARATGATVHRGGTYLCIEGPQFSSKGESRIYRQWGVDVIGMTNMPEAKLAREAELCYSTLALATDYDVWHESEEAVSVEAVVANLLKNAATAKEVLRHVIPQIGPPRRCGCPMLLRNAVITNPSAFPLRTRKALDLFLGKYFPTRRASPPALSPLALPLPTGERRKGEGHRGGERIKVKGASARRARRG
ncbi:MAG: S-methyl-5'-thioadenosine phosphorylase [Candidatus Rokubacteria bacterium]|nr:S-methyl-5'-thioadenosine phosphorylase [Candidatus Rokubacteria bacterium]